MNFSDLIPLALILVVGFMLYQHKAAVLNAINDLRDDGKLNGSNAAPAAVVVDHAQIVSAALQGAAAVTAAAQPSPAPSAPPAAVPAVQAASSQSAVDPRILSAPTVQAAMMALGRGLSPAEVDAWVAYHPSAPDPRTTDASGRPIGDTGQVDATPKPFPTAWDGKPLRLVVDLEAGVTYSCAFTNTGGAASSAWISPAASDPAGQGAAYDVRVVQPDGSEYAYGAPNPSRSIPLSRVQLGACVLKVTSPVRSHAWLDLR